METWKKWQHRLLGHKKSYPHQCSVLESSTKNDNPAPSKDWLVALMISWLRGVFGKEFVNRQSSKNACTSILNHTSWLHNVMNTLQFNENRGTVCLRWVVLQNWKVEDAFTHYFSYRVPISVGDRALAISGSLFNIKLYHLKNHRSFAAIRENLGQTYVFVINVRGRSTVWI